MYKNEILREKDSLLNHGPSCACKYSAFLYVTHTYLVTLIKLNNSTQGH